MSAPTGTGKIVVFEMAILALFAAKERAGHKAVYLAPSKFLVGQKFREWEDKFGTSLGLRLAEVTGSVTSRYCSVPKFVSGPAVVVLAQYL